MKQHVIKVFGERNTGTRAMLQMIRNMPNLTTVIPDLKKPAPTIALQKRVKDRFRGKWLDAYVEALDLDNRNRVGGVAAWKHAAPKFDQSYAKAEANVIFLVRNPYSWLISLYIKPYHARGIFCDTLEQFADIPWLTLGKDNVAPVLNSPMDMWNKKLRAYADFQKRCDIPFYQIKFETFVLTPVDALTAGLEYFGIEAEGLAAIPISVKNDSQTLSELRDYYRQEKWRDRLTRQSVALINQHTDWQIAEQFGYEMLDPKQFPIQLPNIP